MAARLEVEILPAPTGSGPQNDKLAFLRGFCMGKNGSPPLNP